MTALEEKGKARALFSHECLRNNPFFKGRDPKFLDKIIDSASVEVYCEGEIIVKEGDFGDSMYFLHRGSVEILVGEQMEKVAVLSGGDIFGELSILGMNHKRSSTVKALEFCDCRVVHHRPFMSLLKRFPDEQEFFREMAKERTKELKQVEEKNKQNGGQQMRRLSRRISAAMMVSNPRRHSSVGNLTQTVCPSPTARPLSPRLLGNSDHKPKHLTSVGEIAEPGEVSWKDKLERVRARIQAISAFAKMGMPNGLGVSAVPSPSASRADPEKSDFAAAISRRTSVAALVGVLLGGRRKSQAAKSTMASRRQSNANVLKVANSAAASRRGSEINVQPGAFGQRKVVGLAQPQVDFQEVGCEAGDRPLSKDGERRKSLHHTIGKDAEDETDLLPLKKRHHSVAGATFKSMLQDPPSVLDMEDACGHNLSPRGLDGMESVISVTSVSIPVSERSLMSSFAPSPAPILEGDTPVASPRGSFRMNETMTRGSLIIPEGLQDMRTRKSIEEYHERHSARASIDGRQLNSSLVEVATEDQLAVLAVLADKLENPGDYQSERNSDSDGSDPETGAEMRPGQQRSTLQLPDFSADQFRPFGEPIFEGFDGNLPPIRSQSPKMLQHLKPQQRGPKSARRKPLHSIQLGGRSRADTGRKLASRYDCTPWMPRRGVNPSNPAAGNSCSSSTSKLAQYPAPELPPKLVRPLQAIAPLSTEPWDFIGPPGPHAVRSGSQRLISSLTPSTVRERFNMYSGPKRITRSSGSTSGSRSQLGRCDSSRWFRGPRARGHECLESPPRARTAGSVGTGGLFNSDSHTELPRRGRSAGTIGLGPLFPTSDAVEQQSGPPDVRNYNDDGWHFIPACTSSDGSNLPMLPLPFQDTAPHTQSSETINTVIDGVDEQDLNLQSAYRSSGTDDDSAAIGFQAMSVGHFIMCGDSALPLTIERTSSIDANSSLEEQRFEEEASSYPHSASQLSLSLIESAIHGLPAAAQVQ